MNITDLIPYGKENAISRKYLLAKCQEHDLLRNASRDPDRAMRQLMSEAKFHGHPILYCTERSGYYQPTEKEIAELRAYIKAEEHRAKTILASLNSAKGILSDIECGRITKVVLPKTKY